MHRTCKTHPCAHACTHMHPCTHMSHAHCMLACMQARMHTHNAMHPFMHMHTSIQLSMHACRHAPGHMHTCMHVRTCHMDLTCIACMHAHMQTGMLTCTHTLYMQYAAHMHATAPSILPMCAQQPQMLMNDDTLLQINVRPLPSQSTQGRFSRCGLTKEKYGCLLNQL